MIYRNLSSELASAATRAPAITLTGPRQSGKTTLCRSVFPKHPYVNLESLDERVFATDDPQAFLAQFPKGAILDEVQRAPHLFSYLQGIIDNDPAPGRWILSGSQNFSLLEAISQSLAGRTEVHHLLPLTWDEILRFSDPPETLDKALFSGGYPRIFDQKLEPSVWLRSYVTNYVERDVRTLSNIGDLTTFQRFVELCARRTGQLLKYSSLARDCGISQPTAKAWLSILEASYIAFRLPAFSANLSKRLIKMPKLYFYDTGLLCWLLGLRQPEHLLSHPLRGEIFETWVISEILKHRIHQGMGTSTMHGLSFYRNQHGAEVDLLVEQPNRLILLEVKSTETPSKNPFASIRRIQRHLEGSVYSCDAAIAYGGEKFQQRTDGKLIPWRMLRMTLSPDIKPVVQVLANGEPLADANVRVQFPNKTSKYAITDKHGEAHFDLYTSVLPTTVSVAAMGFKEQKVEAWIPAERTIRIDLGPQHDTESAISDMKEYLAEAQYRIKLSDLIQDTIEQVVKVTTSEVFSIQEDNSPKPTTESASERIRRYEATCETLLAIALVGGNWAEEEHYPMWRDALQRLDLRTLDDGYVLWRDLQRYPATLLLYALGLGAIKANRLRFLNHMLRVPLYKNREEDISALQVLAPSCLFEHGAHAQHILQGMNRHQTSLSARIYDTLRPHAERIIPDANRCALAFDKLEILMALSYMHQRPQDRDYAPPGLFTYHDENRRRILQEINESLSTAQDASPFVTSGIFGDTEEDCRKELAHLEKLIEKGRWLWF